MKILSKYFSLLVACVVLSSMMLPQGSTQILLWPNGAPGSEGKSGPEKVRIAEGGDHVISNIHQPSITPYLPSANNATGAAVIIAPGGGHSELWIDHEGYHIAQWLQEHGVAAFVLKYRLAREANSTYKVDIHALGDMQRAIRLVKSRGKEWHIDTTKVGVMGFSAGGEVAALAAMRFDKPVFNSGDEIDRASCRPAFQALIYPGNSKSFEVSKNSPPVFIACGYHDRPDISEGMASLYLQYKKLNIPADLHIYSNVGHGFGLRDTNTGEVTHWPEAFRSWLADNGFLTNKH